jgi:cytoskeletal protein CcmA (bactofilin family)
MWKRDQAVAPTPQPEPHIEPARVPGAPAPEMRVVASSADRIGVDLGKSVVIKGELSASEDLTLHGQMEGKISLPDHTLTVGPQADVKADITAKAVVVVGMVTGRVTARDKIEIRPTGTVAGDIVSPRLVVAEGGNLRGKVEMPRP